MPQPHLTVRAALAEELGGEVNKSVDGKGIHFLGFTIYPPVGQISLEVMVKSHLVAHDIVRIYKERQARTPDEVGDILPVSYEPLSQIISHLRSSNWAYEARQGVIWTVSSLAFSGDLGRL